MGDRLGYIFVCGIILFYFFVRLYAPQTFEFGYDQPKLVSSVIEMIDKRDFLLAQKYVDTNPYKSHSYGPFLLYFLTPWVMLTHDPQALSIFMVIFNSLGVIGLFLLGKHFFNLKVGFLAALFLSASFWHVIFSRMVYQPSPLPVFLVLITYGLLKVGNKKITFWYFALPILFGLSLQIHLIMLPVVLVGLVIIFSQRGFQSRSFWLGTIFSLLFYLPVLYYDMTHRWETVGSFLSGGESLAQGNLGLRAFHVFQQFFLVASGGGIEWQAGYGYADFVRNLSWVLWPGLVLSFFLVVIGLTILFRRIVPGHRTSRIVTAVIFSMPVFLIFVPLPDLVPRYFYPLTPLFSLVLAIVIDKLFEKNGMATTLLAISLTFGLVFSSIVIVGKYFSFVLSYDYPKGFLSSFSDVPYSFTSDALDFAARDAKNNGACSLLVSSDPGKPGMLALNWVQFYIWNHTDFDKGPWCNERKEAYYIVAFMNSQKPMGITKFHRFGPYVVYAYP